MASGYFTLEGKKVELCNEKRHEDLQFSTLYHVCNKECEAIMAESKKDAHLIKDGHIRLVMSSLMFFHLSAHGL